MNMGWLTASTSLLLVCLCAFSVQVTGQKESRKTFSECGATNPNGNFIDLSEPDQPGPFHDLTSTELRKLREFLENDPNIRAVKSSHASINSSYIFTADLHLPKKEDVLNYLDKGGSQPIRQAHVIMFRGDKYPPVVEEWVCGPLPDIAKCELGYWVNKRNPVEFSVRPLNGLEMEAINEVLLKKVDEKVGYILMQSYGAKFTVCPKKKGCLTSSSAPVGTGISGDMMKRYMWVTAAYDLPYPSLHILDFSVLANLNETDPDKWTIEKVWYGKKMFESLDDLISQYNSNSIPKTKVTKPKDDQNLFSSLRRRGDFMPPKPQRPPRLVEPDGKRYTVKAKKVEYMGWTFNYRLSPLTGPALYNVRFKGERILYELTLNQIADFNSGHGGTLNSLVGSLMIGSRSRAVIPGAGCPETGTSLSSVFLSQYGEEPAVYDSSMCLFENSDGHAMRNHHAYTTSEGGYYNGMLDTLFILRTAISVRNNDYIVDYLFHQNGVIHTKVMNTGYIYASFYSSTLKPYGHRIQENLLGNLHHILFNFKVDLDVGGTSNRYETVDILKEKSMLTSYLDQPYSQTRINSSLKTTEKEAVFNFNFSMPRYHIVHNNDKKNKYGESRAYRIEMRDSSKNLLEENLGNENSISWARHQMVVTKRKDNEAHSSSIYGMLDSLKPVVDFNSFFEDDEDIIDEDLVFWITSGMHLIPHSEDLPNTGAITSKMSFFLLPHNYFPECPSMGSRDAIFIEYKDPKDPSKGLKVDRNGNSREQCIVPKPSLEDDVAKNPDRVLESRRRNPTDF